MADPSSCRCPASALSVSVGRVLLRGFATGKKEEINMRVFVASAILAITLGVSACGSDNPTNPTPAARAGATPTPAPTPAPTPTPTPTPTPRRPDSHANPNPSSRRRDDQRRWHQWRAVLLAESGNPAGGSDGRVAQHRQHHAPRRVGQRITGYGEPCCGSVQPADVHQRGQ